MFKKENRLTKTKEFENVWKKGRSSFDKITGVKIVKNKLNVNRFGVIVSTKVSKKAVERNKIKRRIRETLKELLIEIIGDFDITIVALPLSKEKDKSELEKSIKSNLERLRVLK